VFHRAANRAFPQGGLKPATTLPPLCLADRRNDDFGRFPSQERLAADACISRSALNEHLRTLEGKGLIRRLQRGRRASADSSACRRSRPTPRRMMDRRIRIPDTAARIS